VTALNESQTTNDDRYTKVKQENAALLTKIHALEEQLRDIELQSEERKREDDKRFKDAMARHDREKSYECEQYINRIYSLQQELLESRDESRKYQVAIEKIKYDKNELEEVVNQKGEEILALQEEVTKLKEFTRRHRDEEIANERVIDVLNQELDEMRRVESWRRSSAQDLREMRIVNELDEELQKLKAENRGLREANEELQAQLLNSRLEEGRSLLREGQPASLAHELDDLTLEQLRKAIREQKDVNTKLRAYIDGILLSIVENYPQLLEVKQNK
jgi:Rab11 family-interacting protein 3/4